VCVYAMGHLKAGKTVADVATGRANVLAGTVAATQPTAGATTQPADETAAAAANTRTTTTGAERAARP
jgi:hypothetical protein